MGSYALWIGAVFVPFATVVLNLVFRQRGKVPVSAHSDIYMFMFAVDISIVVSQGDFLRLVQWEEFRQIFVPLILGFALTSLMTWGYCVSQLEGLIHSSYKAGRYRPEFPTRRVVATAVGVFFLTFAHVFLFVYNPLTL